MQDRTWDGQSIADTPPFGAAIVVYRRFGDRVEVLMLHRAHEGPDFAGDWAWGPPSGARCPGEDVERCARRELAEEIGVELPLHRTDAGSDHWIVFLAAAPADLRVTLSAEHDRYAWLPLDRAADLTAPEVVRVQLLGAARAIGNGRGRVMPNDDICFATAVELAGRIRRRELSAREVMAAYLAQIERVNPTVNAIVSMLEPERALAMADDADRALAAGEEVGPLHGLPIAFKDLIDAVGFPTTHGSPIFAANYPERDALIVERIKRAGAIGIGKTNVPEFGLGSHTFNPVFGATRNPYDPSKSAGGSSGGAAAALASGMLPIADGSDTGGSLRNPGNFNNVVGFRVSPGVVPNWPSSAPAVGLGVKGPLARTVADVALLLSVMAGYDARDQATLDLPPERFTAPLARDFRGVRVAWCPDLGGLPLDPRVRAVIEAQRQVFAGLGCVVEEAAPGLTDADGVFMDLRAFLQASGRGSLLTEHRDRLKPEAVWNIEEGLKLSAADVGDALARQSRLLERVRRFMERYEYLVCAVNQVPPFAIELRYPTEIAGVPMEHYIAWMRSASWITATRLPAISVPAGFTPEGLPVGIQIAGRFRSDVSVLQLAHAFEGATGTGRRRPPVAAG